MLIKVLLVINLCYVFANNNLTVIDGTKNLTNINSMKNISINITNIKLPNITDVINITFKDVEVILVYEDFKEQKLPKASYANLKDVIHGSQLYALRVTGNNISVLLKDSVSSVFSVNRIELANNQIKTLTPGAFGNLRDVFIGLNSNLLTDIPAGVFTNLTGIKGLSFENNRIKSIDSDAFKNMIDLKVLNLSKNKLTRWNIEWLENTIVDNILLFENSIIKLPNKAFAHRENSSEMEFVDFTGNNIAELDSSALHNTKSIQYLHLGRNMITKIPDNFFANVTKIHYISFINNKLDVLPKDLNVFNIVDKLDFSDNPLLCNVTSAMETWAKAAKKIVNLPAKCINPK